MADSPEGTPPPELTGGEGADGGAPPAESPPPESPPPEAATEAPSSPAAGTPPATTDTETDTEKEDAKDNNNKKKKKGKRDLSMDSVRIGIMGAGKTAEAIIKGYLAAKVSADRILVTGASEKSLQRLKLAHNVKTHKLNSKLMSKIDVIFLCCHGSVYRKCVTDDGRYHPLCTNFLSPTREKRIIMSLISGVEIKELKKVLLDPSLGKKSEKNIEVCRVLINAACAHGMGLCAIDKDPDSSEVSAFAKELLQKLSPSLLYIPATQMDAACAVAGHGLAFCFAFMNAICDGAFKIGIPKDAALKIAAKVCQCGARLLLETGKYAEDLRDSSCTPSGSATYGLHVLDKVDIASSITAAVEAAYKRAEELAKK